MAYHATHAALTVLVVLTLSTSAQAMNPGDTYVVTTDGYTGDEATTEPKADANDGLAGDNPEFRRHNVARAHGTYWYTSAYQLAGEPDPSGEQWVDYVPDFATLGSGRYAITTHYRYTDNRAGYDVPYTVHHAGGTTTIWRNQRENPSGDSQGYNDVSLGEYDLDSSSWVRVEDPGSSSITFFEMEFTYIGPSTPAETGLLEPIPSTVTTFTPMEVALGAASLGLNPYTEGPEVTAVFTGTSGDASGLEYTVKGFWDGGNVWRVRFAPTATGEWSLTTSSSDSALNITGQFFAQPPEPSELEENPLLHGFLQADGFAWRLSDETPFVPVGDTQWSFSEELFTDEWFQWVDAMRDRSFNTFLGSVWLAIYTRNGTSPFAARDPQTDRLQPSFFQQLDQWVEYANSRGIMMGLTIGGFPSNSQWWSKLNTRARDDRWFRYVVRRYAAYNVRWGLYGEVNEASPPWGTWQNEVLHKAQLIKDEDPYDHPIGSHHNSVDTSSASSPLIDYLEVQGEGGDRQYGKPIWHEEFWYEAYQDTSSITAGAREGTQALHRNFVSKLAFPTIGSLMRQHAPMPYFPPRLASEAGVPLRQWLVENDPGFARMADFADLYGNLNTLDYEPVGNLVNRGEAGRFGASYAIYLPGGGDVTIDLSESTATLQAKVLQIHTGATADSGAVTGGAPRLLSSGTTDDAVIVLVGPGANRAPLVYDSRVAVPKNTPTMIQLPAYDIDGPAPLQYEIIQSPQHGALSGTAPLLQYTPDADYVGPDLIGFRATDAAGASSEAAEIDVRVVDTDANIPPEAESTTVRTTSGTGVSFGFPCRDPDDGPSPLSVELLTDPSHGALSGDGLERTYTSNGGFVGTDQLLWRAWDGLDSSAVALLTIRVTPVDLVTNLQTSSSNAYIVVENGLQNGAAIYSDRAYTFVDLPQALIGSTYVRTPNDDKSSTTNPLFTFDIAHESIVYVVYDERIQNRPAWLSTFQDSGEDISIGAESYSLLYATFAAGSVSLGNNGCVDPGCSMYSVIVVPTALRENAPPVVYAGDDTTVERDGQLTLIGSVFDDTLPNGVLDIEWSLVEAPGTIQLSAPNAATTDATFSTPGNYTLALTASDGEYTTEDTVVVVVNELAASSCTDDDDCGPNESCVEQDGEKVCECDMGYSRRGTTCTDIDECAERDSRCGPGATCTNTEGGFVCECKPGFTRDGERCVAAEPGGGGCGCATLGAPDRVWLLALLVVAFIRRRRV